MKLLGKAMSDIRIGTDIEEVARFQRLLASKPSLLEKIFTKHEWEYAQTKTQKAQTLAGIWCAKEATFKALSPFVYVEITAIEIVKNPQGYPEVEINHPLFDSHEFHISVSIAHTKEMATANTLVQKIP